MTGERGREEERRVPPDGAAEEIDDIDPGFARARTELAWTRTAISFGAVGAAILRTAPIAGALVLALSAVVWGLGQLMRRYERDRDPRAGAARRPRLLLVITITVTAVSLIALAATFAGGASPLGTR